jgi:hypothetical protein
MAFDANHSNTVLFGGADLNYTFFGDTWVWDGTNWQQQNPTTIPPARSQAEFMTYDPVAGQVLMFGGSGPTYYEDNTTWVWNGTNWSARPVAAPFSPVQTVGLAFNGMMGQIVMLAYPNPGPSILNTWILSKTGWNQQLIIPFPSSEGYMIYDSARQDIVLFSISGETWIWGIPSGSHSLFNNFGSGNTYITNNSWQLGGPSGHAFINSLAAAFTAPQMATLGSISLALNYQGGSDYFTVYLYTDSGGLPAAPIESFALASNVPDIFSGTLVTVSSSTHPVLTAGSVYWIVVEASLPGDWGGWLSSLNDGGVWATMTNGGAWTRVQLAPGATRGVFEVTGTPVP